MKNLFLFTLLLLSTAYFQNTLHAQLTQTSGPGGGPISSFASNGTDLYVGTGAANTSGYGGGMYHSTDNGLTWTAFDYPITKREDRNISAISVSGSNIVAGSLGGIVYSSTDGGATWTRTALSSNKVVTAITTDGTNFYVGNDGGGVFSATIGTTSWTPMNTGLSNKRITGLLSSGSYLYASTTFGGTALFISTNSGVNWTLDTLPSGVFNAFSVAMFGGKLFLGCQNGVFTSTNNGGTWTGPLSGISYAVYTFTSIGSTVYAGNSSGLFSMPVSGSSWTTVSSTYGVTALFSNSTGLFAGVTSQSGFVNNGILLSTNGGTTWSPRSTGVAATTIHSMLNNGSTLFALTKGQGLYSSTDNGTTWTLSSANAVGYDAQSQNLGIINGKLFASSSTGLLTSTDNGTSWTPSSPGFTPQAFYSFGSKLFAGENGGIRVSTDEGATWNQANTGLSGYLSTNCFGSKGDKLFAGLCSAGFFVSADSGATWTIHNTGLSNTRIRSIATLGSKIFVATDDGGVFVSTDEGASWTAKNSGLSSYNIWSLAVTGNALFAGTNDGVVVSQDSGETWSSITPSNFIANVVLIKGTDLFCGTLTNGVWKTPVSGVVTSVDEPYGENIASGFSLSQNFPNPFNPSTVISYSLSVNSIVTLKIYNILGKEIATLLENKEVTQGTYEMTFDASKFSSGMYFYKLTTTNQHTGEVHSQTKTMTLVK